MFILIHLVGNLLLLFSDPLPFNTYAYHLHSLGGFLKVLEGGLATVFVVHIVMAIVVSRKNHQARPQAYAMTANAGGVSHKSAASDHMIYTGLLLLVFLVWHLQTFTYGPGADQGYLTEIKGHQARDLYRLVSDVFAQPAYMLTYVAIMGFLGLHLRHGFASAFQSLGIHHPRLSPAIHVTGVVVALLFAVGFIAIPVVVYLRSHGL